MEVLLLTLALLLLISLLEVFFSARSEQKLTRTATNLSLLAISATLNTALLGAVVVSLPILLRDAGVGVLVVLPVPIWLTWIVGFVALDLFAYVWHRLSHQVQWLWRLHAVHHADPHLDVSTVVRAHPIHGMLTVIAAALFAAAMGFPPELLLWYQIVSTLVSLSHHTDLAWLQPRWDRRLSTVFCTPAVHRVHHSQHAAHHDSNYGGVLSLWDRWFGSYVADSPDAEIRFGIASLAKHRASNLLISLWLPVLLGKTKKAPEERL